MNTPPRVATRNRRWLIPTVVACIVGLPMLMILIPLISFRASNASAIRRLEAKIKQNKEPLTLQDLAAAYPSVPDEENGAILLLELWEKDDPAYWKAFREGASPLPKRHEAGYEDDLPILGKAGRVSRNAALPPVNLTAAKVYLHQQREHMNAVRRALQRPHFRFPIQITNGFAALIPHLPEIKKEVQNFRIESLVATESGNVDGAIDASEQAVALGKAGAKEPFLISQLVGIACYQIALNEMERLLTRRPLSLQQLQKLDRLVDDLQMPDGLAFSLISERVFGLSAFALPAQSVAGLIGEPGEESGEASKRGYQIGIGLLKITGIKDADRRFMLETMDTAIGLARRNDAESLKQTEKLFGNIQTVATKFPPKIYSAMLLPALGKAATKFASFEARRRAARVAVAIERYRLAHRRLPADLNELVPQFLPQLPIDPFDGEAIRYKRLASGYVVYSIGADRVDNDGTERPQPGGAKPFDDTFIVER